MYWIAVGCPTSLFEQVLQPGRGWVVLQLGLAYSWLGAPSNSGGLNLSATNPSGHHPATPTSMSQTTPARMSFLNAPETTSLRPPSGSISSDAGTDAGNDAGTDIGTSTSTGSWDGDGPSGADGEINDLVSKGFSPMLARGVVKTHC